MRIIIIFSLLFISNHINAEILKPNPKLLPEEVISIQLSALKNNDTPYLNAGIEQTWEFAHPSNKIYTGPLNKFINMMNSDNYVVMINHLEHSIIKIKESDQISFFLVELIGISGQKFGFQWVVEKVIDDGNYKNCWMTVSVSQPILLSKEI